MINKKSIAALAISIVPLLGFGVPQLVSAQSTSAANIAQTEAAQAAFNAEYPNANGYSLQPPLTLNATVQPGVVVDPGASGWGSSIKSSGSVGAVSVRLDLSNIGITTGNSYDLYYWCNTLAPAVTPPASEIPTSTPPYDAQTGPNGIGTTITFFVNSFVTTHTDFTTIPFEVYTGSPQTVVLYGCNYTQPGTYSLEIEAAKRSGLVGGTPNGDYLPGTVAQVSIPVTIGGATSQTTVDPSLGLGSQALPDCANNAGSPNLSAMVTNIVNANTTAGVVQPYAAGYPLVIGGSSGILNTTIQTNDGYLNGYLGHNTFGTELCPPGITVPTGANSYVYNTPEVFTIQTPFGPTPQISQAMRYIKISIATNIWASVLETQVYGTNGNQLSYSPTVSSDWEGQGYAVGAGGLNDGSLSTGWNSGEDGGSFIMDLGSVQNISRISLYPQNPGNAPETYTISGSVNGASYFPIAYLPFGYGNPEDGLLPTQWLDYTLASGLWTDRVSTPYTTPTAPLINGSPVYIPPLALPGPAAPTAPIEVNTSTSPILTLPFLSTSTELSLPTSTSCSNSSNCNLINSTLNTALSGFSQVLSSNLGGSQATGSSASGSGSISSSGSASTSGTGSCGAAAGTTIANSLQTLQAVSGVLSTNNLPPALLSSVQNLISAVAQVLSSLASCLASNQ